MGRDLVPVPKLTQVGVVNNQRRSREFSLRNSANLIRNFGKRIAANGDAPAGKAVGGRREMAQATVY